jgi:hypothetical protein
MTQPTTTEPDQARPAPPPAGYLTGLAAAVTTLADRAAAAAEHPSASGPPLRVLPHAARLLRIAAELIDILAPYTRRCDLARAAFTAGTDWTICGPDLHAGTLHLVTTTVGDLDGCTEHLAAARARSLGLIEDPAVRRRIDNHVNTGTHPDDASGQDNWRRYHTALNQINPTPDTAPADTSP